MFSFLFSPWGSMRHLWNHIVLRFLWYSSADQGTCYPASRGYIFAVWAGVRKCQLIPRKCSLFSQGRNMQILHAEFDKKKISHLFSRKKIILIPLELKLLLNDKMINYKQKRQVNFTSIKESPYWLNNFPKHHPSYESVLNFVRPIYLLSFLIVLLFMFGSISFVACIFRSTDQLTAVLTKLCVAFVTLLSFSYIFLSGLFHRTTLRSCSTELYKSVVRQLKCWKNPVDARLQSWLILWITKLLKRMVPTQRDSSLYKIEKSCTREEQGRITISYGR